MINQLLLSKRLYIIGSNYVEAPDPISAGMAISLFQDSIEILCWSVLKDLDAPVKENTPFTSFFDLVEKAPKKVHPRICGDEPSYNTTRTILVRCSPHMRG